MNWNILERSWKQIKGNSNFGLDNFTHHQQEAAAGKQSQSLCETGQMSGKNDGLRIEELQSRRALLRGALALGCCLITPFTLLSAQAASTEAAAPKAAKKMSKASVKYQSSAKGEEKCSGCANFIAESNTCKRVGGKISPNGYCMLWVKKS